MSVRTTIAEIVRKFTENMSLASDVWLGYKAKELPVENRGAQLDAAISQIMEQAYERDEWAWVNDIYVEDDGSISAIFSSRGKLYRGHISMGSEGAVLDSWEEVEIVYTPRGVGFTITRQRDGTYRWFAIAETAVLLRVGEIDSRELFDDFVANVDEYGYPTLRFYHQEGMDFGDTDWLAREENCLLASGTFRDHPLAEAMVASAERGDTWGTSVGFMPTQEAEIWEVSEGVTIPVNKRGYLREISALPENRAASWFTSIITEETRMRPDVKEALVRLFGSEEDAQGYIDTVDETNRAITENDLITRSSDGDNADTTDDDHEGVADETTEYVTAEELEEVLAAVRESLPNIDLSPIETALSQLTERISELAESAEKQAAEIAERFAALEVPLNERLRELIDDMPDNKPQPEYRPRQVNSAENPSMADLASATLSQMNK